MLITNSDYHYTNEMMSFAYNRFMPHGSTWRDLFDMVCYLAFRASAVLLHTHLPCAKVLSPQAFKLNMQLGLLALSDAQCPVSYKGILLCCYLLMVCL